MEHYMVAVIEPCTICAHGAVLRDGLCRSCFIGHACNETQQRVLAAVRRLQPTTMHDVADEVGFASASSAAYQLRHLQRLGLVDWSPEHRRTIRETISWQKGENRE